MGAARRDYHGLRLAAVVVRGHLEHRRTLSPVSPWWPLLCNIWSTVGYTIPPSHLNIQVFPHHAAVMIVIVRECLVCDLTLKFPSPRRK